ncbi:acyl-CoA dehydrogenase [Actinoplanes lobatus]|uniref:Broad-specificity linear acyl-CoA dehydrogenase FadE5 n=1 Tax=Actinoplanes lobatus TaxID=113568 RepID=A0A7W7MF53_9ACTN|nr:acyl-CoA dehydrogenase [Actinoplanes lobatus]MBB4747977.1 alkylation response protein AidB-like acyl-CoA dehydrogenase [Actinoplanes lobatus]GGN81030.1 acyl-CoA dehydrogenase [Actinoplanes lobatus]GIE41556.1 acyl-CoA dehydrogenase [Actinoplanes lobatus]
MTHYKSNLRDLQFNLFEVFGAEKSLGQAPFDEFDLESARDVLAEVDRLAREDLAASYTDADRNPPVFDPATHTAPLPESFKKSFETFMASEFWRLDLPTGLGGTPAPRSLVWAVAEQILGSNAPIWMYSSGPSFANVIWHEGTEEQREWAKLFVEKQWGSTMVLTEPDAGSDVGAGRARAIAQPDGSWHIEGVKRFITSGEHDLTDNIIHYVLARPVGVEGVGGPGTKGLSLFIVPKYHFDPATGELGERNGVYATNVEHKMGLKVSNTCEMTFGEHGTPAKGWLLGEVHQGIRQMFLIIENARMMVGTKAIATLSTGYLNALEYAKNRVQGADLLQSGDKDAPRVAITQHPDVRRSLMTQKAYAEALRALVIYTATWQDKVAIAEAAGDEKAAKQAAKINDFLLPLVKGVGSERAYELLGAESLQTFGGSGFLQDYPLEQYVRDAKIDTLYEGTTAIQSLDLIFRKIVKDNGQALGVLAAEIQGFVESEAGNGQLKDERLGLGKALVEMQNILGITLGWLQAVGNGEARELYKIGLSSRRILLALGDVVLAWLLLRQAEVALNALNGEVSEADKKFYTGKVAAARFFVREILPRIGADRRIIENTTLDLMDLDEDAF